MQTKHLYTLTVAGLSIWVSICAAPAGAQDVFVTKDGSFAPPEGGAAGAFRMIETAVCAAPEAGTISVGPGTYRETFSIEKPVTLTAPDGPFTLGDLSNLGETTLTVVSYNVHLFGTEDVYSTFYRRVFGDLADFVLEFDLFAEFMDDLIDSLKEWQDEARAGSIADAVRAAGPAPDVIILQEVWDDTLGQILISDFHDEGYTHSFFGTDRSEFINFYPFTEDPQHSGLLVLSKFELKDAEQIIFDAEEDSQACRTHLALLINACTTLCVVGPAPLCGPCLAVEIPLTIDACDDLSDAYSSKSFIRARIVKDGFPVLIYGTHTQASNRPPGRPQQTQQIAEDVKDFREDYPDHAIVIGGDFNERGEVGLTKEAITGYVTTLGPLGFTGGAHDVARNAPDPCFVDESSPTVTVKPETDTLHGYFWPPDENDPVPDPRKTVRIDYFFSNGSLDGDVELLPLRTVVKEYKASNTISGDGSYGYHEDKNLSDHYGLWAKFQLYRISD